MSTNAGPYLSFVVTSRNDGNLSETLPRTQMFVDSLLSQVARFGLVSELILVEWNPPPDSPRLHHVLEWRYLSDKCKVRVIEVAPALHGRFANSEAIPLFQMIAKNVGIRRAQGQFVLATNIDILFSNELIAFLSSRTLETERMYRINRFDVPFQFPEHLTLDARREWCAQHVSRIYRYLATVRVVDGIVPPPIPPPASLREKLVDLITQREPRLHTNACGDFTLLSAEYWRAVGGYPEFPLRAMKLDGLLCYAAHFAGAREKVLDDPMRIYHLEHPARADGASIALAGRDSDGPDLQLSLPRYYAWVDQMRRRRRPILFNKNGWGLENEALPETVIA